MRTLALTVLSALAVACSGSAVPSPFVRASSIRGDADSTIDCDSGHWRGRISIASDVRLTATAVSTQTAAAAPLAFMVNGVALAIEAQGLRLGATFVPLAGEVAVKMRAEGIFVQDKKVADMPAR